MTVRHAEPLSKDKYWHLAGCDQILFFKLLLILGLISTAQSSCTEQSSCDTCVGTFKETDSCTWCTDDNSCVSTSSLKNGDDGGEDDKSLTCGPKDQADTCPVSYYTIVFIIILVVVLSLCCGLLLARRFRGNNSRETDALDEPLMSEQARDIFGRRSMGPDGRTLSGWMCIICGYDNKPRAQHCPMCGTSHEFSNDYKSYKSERQRLARRRKLKEKAQMREQRLAAAAAQERREDELRRSRQHEKQKQSNVSSSLSGFAGLSSVKEKGDNDDNEHDEDTSVNNNNGDEEDEDEEADFSLVLDSGLLCSNMVDEDGEGDEDNDQSTSPLGRISGGRPETTFASRDTAGVDGDIDDSMVSASGVEGTSADLDTSRTSVLSQTDRWDAFNYRRLNALSTRQKVARRRKMWQREINPATGELQWVRKLLNDTQIGNSTFGWSPRPSEQNTPVKQAGSAVASGGGAGGGGESDQEPNAGFGGSLLRALMGMSTSGMAEGGATDKPNAGNTSGRPSDRGDSGRSTRLSDAEEGTVNSLWRSSSPVTPRDSFDNVIGNVSSPGFTSVFGQDGKITWEQVESGMPAVAGTDVLARQAKRLGGGIGSGRRVDDFFRSSRSGAGSSSMSESRHTFLSVLSDGFRETDFSRLALKMEDMHAAASLPFREKQFWFLSRLAELQRPWADGCIRMDVARDNVLHDSYQQMLACPRRHLHRYMRIQFQGEPGVDAGGLEREWFSLVAEKLLDPSLGLFASDGAASGTYHISPLSNNPATCTVADEHLAWFRFAGRFFAKGIMEQQSLGASLSLPLRKQLLAIPIMFSDLEFVDADVHRNLEWLRQNEGAENMYLDFTITYAARGVTVTLPLKEGGADVAVTDANKQEYLLLTLKHRMLDSVRPQLEHFLKGFYEVLPSDLLSVFDYQELELLMCGLPELDLEDWIRHTEYLGEFKRLGRKHRVVRWFWEVVQEFSQEERVRLLQFATGCSRLPVQGFKALQSNDGNYRKFNLQAIPRQISCYPRAHTCFNKIDLPLYKSRSELEAYLSVVVNMEVTGFTMD